MDTQSTSVVGKVSVVIRSAIGTSLLLFTLLPTFLFEGLPFSLSFLFMLSLSLSLELLYELKGSIYSYCKWRKKLKRKNIIWYSIIIYTKNIIQLLITILQFNSISLIYNFFSLSPSLFLFEIKQNSNTIKLQEFINYLSLWDKTNFKNHETSIIINYKE